MTILHIACIKNDLFSGVPAMVPRMILSEVNVKGNNNIAFYNAKGIKIEGLEELQVGIGDGLIKNLEPPFNKPDLVVFHEVYYPIFIKLYCECRMRHIKYLIVPHGCLTREAQNIKKFKKRIGNTAAFARFIEHAESLRFLSIHEKKNTVFKKYGFVCPSGIKLPEKAIVDKRYDRSEDKDCFIRLTYIGRIDPYIKGLDILAESINANKNVLRKEKCKISLYGPLINGNALERLKKYISDTEIADLLEIKDPVWGEEKERILINTDVFVLFSRSEGLPSSVMEALGYGVPCIVSKGTGMARIIEQYNAGWTENSIPLENILVAAVTHRDDAKSKNARKLAEENFDCRISARRIIKKYQLY